MTAQTLLPLDSRAMVRNLLLSGDFVALSQFCGISPERAFAAISLRNDLNRKIGEMSENFVDCAAILDESLRIEEIEASLVNSLLSPSER